MFAEMLINFRFGKFLMPFLHNMMPLPTFLHNMMPFERLNGFIKGFVRNRSRPDGSIAKGFLTYECVSFCQNFLQIGRASCRERVFRAV